MVRISVTFSTPDARTADRGRQPAHVRVDAERDIGGALELEHRGERHVAADLHAIVAPIDAALLCCLVKLCLGVGGWLRQARRRAAVERRPLAVGLLKQIVEVLRQAAGIRRRVDQRYRLNRLPRRRRGLPWRRWCGRRRSCRHDRWRTLGRGSGRNHRRRHDHDRRRQHAALALAIDFGMVAFRDLWFGPYAFALAHHHRVIARRDVGTLRRHAAFALAVDLWRLALRDVRAFACRASHSPYARARVPAGSLSAPQLGAPASGEWPR